MDSLPNTCVNVADYSEKVFPKLKFDSHTRALLMKIRYFFNNRKLPYTPNTCLL